MLTVEFITRSPALDGSTPEPGLVSHVNTQALTSFDCYAFLAKTPQDTPPDSSCSKYHWGMAGMTS